MDEHRLACKIVEAYYSGDGIIPSKDRPESEALEELVFERPSRRCMCGKTRTHRWVRSDIVCGKCNRPVRGAVWRRLAREARDLARQVAVRYEIPVRVATRYLVELVWMPIGAVRTALKDFVLPTDEVLLSWAGPFLNDGLPNPRQELDMLSKLAWALWRERWPRHVAAPLARAGELLTGRAKGDYAEAVEELAAAINEVIPEPWYVRRYAGTQLGLWPGAIDMTREQVQAATGLQALFWRVIFHP